VSETTILAIVGVLGTLAGVVAGRWLEAGQADREMRRRTYHEYAAIVLEQLHVNNLLNQKIAEVGIDGMIEPIHRADLTPDFYRAVAMAQIVATGTVRRELAKVSDAVGRAIDVVAEDGETYDVASQAALEAIWDFEGAASVDLSPRHRRIWSRLQARFAKDDESAPDP
jgi:hypothetical protein